MIHDQTPFIELPRLRPARLECGAQAGENPALKQPSGGSADHACSSSAQRDSPDPRVPLPALRDGPPAGETASGHTPRSSSAAVARQTFSGVPVAAFEDVMCCRREQIERWGHTPEKDRARPIVGFLVDVHAYAGAAREDHQFNHGGQDCLPRVRQRLIKLAALTLAAIDRIDAEGAQVGPGSSSEAVARSGGDSATREAG